MRPIHFDCSTGRGVTLPLCGAWGSLSSGWTDDPAGVTCDACLAALARARAAPPAPPALRPA